MPKYRFEQIAINSIQKKKPIEEDRFTYIGLEHLDSGCLKVTRYGSEVAPIGEKLIMHKGDVLFGKRRAYQKKVAIAPFDGIFSAHGMVLRPNTDVIDSQFFPLFISSDYFLNAAIEISVGSLSPTINWKDLKCLEFELPDLESQRKLAKVLWSMNTAMDAYKELIAATDELVKSQFIEMFGNPIKNDKHWPTMKMKDAAPPTPFVDEINQTPNGFWLLNLDMIESNSGHIIKKNYVFKDKIGQSTTKFSSNYVLFSKLRPYLNKVVIPDSNGYATTELIPLLPNKQFLTQTYLAQLLRGDEFLSFISKHVSGTKMPRVSMDIFWNFQVMLPPLILQKQFTTFIKQSDKSQFIEMFNPTVVEKKGWMQTPISKIIFKPINGEWGKDDPFGTGIKVLRTTNFTDTGYINYTNVSTRCIDNKKIDTKVLQDGDILIEKSGGSDTKPVGRVVLYHSTPEKYLFNNFTALLRPIDQSINSRFLFMFLFISYWAGKTKFYENKTTGIHNLQLLNYLDNTIIPVPPIDIQNKFATFFAQSDKSKFAVLRHSNQISIFQNLFIR